MSEVELEAERRKKFRWRALKSFAQRKKWREKKQQDDELKKVPAARPLASIASSKNRTSNLGGAVVNPTTCNTQTRHSESKAEEEVVSHSVENEKSPPWDKDASLSFFADFRDSPSRWSPPRDKVASLSGFTGSRDLPPKSSPPRDKAASLSGFKGIRDSQPRLSPPMDNAAAPSRVTGIRNSPPRRNVPLSNMGLTVRELCGPPAAKMEPFFQSSMAQRSEQDDFDYAVMHPENVFDTGEPWFEDPITPKESPVVQERADTLSPTSHDVTEAASSLPSIEPPTVLSVTEKGNRVDSKPESGRVDSLFDLFPEDEGPVQAAEPAQKAGNSFPSHQVSVEIPTISDEVLIADEGPCLDEAKYRSKDAALRKSRVKIVVTLPHDTAPSANKARRNLSMENAMDSKAKEVTSEEKALASNEQHQRKNVPDAKPLPRPSKMTALVDVSIGAAEASKPRRDGASEPKASPELSKKERWGDVTREASSAKEAARDKSRPSLEPSVNNQMEQKSPDAHVAGNKSRRAGLLNSSADLSIKNKALAAAVAHRFRSRRAAAFHSSCFQESGVPPGHHSGKNATESDIAENNSGKRTMEGGVTTEYHSGKNAKEGGIAEKGSGKNSMEGRRPEKDSDKSTTEGDMAEKDRDKSTAEGEMAERDSGKSTMESKVAAERHSPVYILESEIARIYGGARNPMENILHKVACSMNCGVVEDTSVCAPACKPFTCEPVVATDMDDTAADETVKASSSAKSGDKSELERSLRQPFPLEKSTSFELGKSETKKKRSRSSPVSSPRTRKSRERYARKGEGRKGDLLSSSNACGSCVDMEQPPHHRPRPLKKSASFEHKKSERRKGKRRCSSLSSPRTRKACTLRELQSFAAEHRKERKLSSSAANNSGDEIEMRPRRLKRSASCELKRAERTKGRESASSFSSAYRSASHECQVRKVAVPKEEEASAVAASDDGIEGTRRKQLAALKSASIEAKKAELLKANARTYSAWLSPREHVELERLRAAQLKKAVAESSLTALLVVEVCETEEGEVETFINIPEVGDEALGLKDDPDSDCEYDETLSCTATSSSGSDDNMEDNRSKAYSTWWHIKDPSPYLIDDEEYSSSGSDVSFSSRDESEDGEDYDDYDEHEGGATDWIDMFTFEWGAEMLK